MPKVRSLFSLLALLAGCSDPDCPADLIQVGKICRHCAEGTEKVGNRCVPVDARGDDQDTGAGNTSVERSASDVGDEEETDGENLPVLDLDAGRQVCFLDRDKDGVGAGNPVDCDSGDLVGALGAGLSQLGNDCDDNSALRSPSLTDICGDKIDNDCDGRPDDEANNACGGPCTAQLSHQPGEPCDNGLMGACLSKGAYKCEGAVVRCDAPMVNRGAETCGDNIDNDCDGTTDEPDGIDAPTWYQDCDGDGYAASAAGSVRSCTQPVNSGSCGWTQVIPQADTKTNWDCNDGSALYKPGAAFGLPSGDFTSWDFNCDGIFTPDPKPGSAPGSSFLVCADSIITSLSKNLRECSPTNDARWNNCYFWSAPGGLYMNEPPTKCPDNARQLDVREGVVDPWGVNDFAPKHAATCRSGVRRSPLSLRTHPFRSDTDTTPGAWVCTVKTVGPAWPCR